MTEAMIWQLLGLDPERLVALASAAEQFAAEYGVRDVAESRARLPQGQTGRANLAAVSGTDLKELHAATLLVTAASNWLAVGEVDRSRSCFDRARALVIRFSVDDAYVLALCAQSSVNAWRPDPHLSGWARELVSCLRSASTSQWLEQPSNFEAHGEFPVSHLPNQDVRALTQEFAGSADNEHASMRRQRSDAAADRLLERAVGGAYEAPADQQWLMDSGTLVALEPELLAIGLIGAVWRRRWQLKPKERSLSPRTLAVRLGAESLLE